MDDNQLADGAVEERAKIFMQDITRTLVLFVLGSAAIIGFVLLR